MLVVMFCIVVVVAVLCCFRFIEGFHDLFPVSISFGEESASLVAENPQGVGFYKVDTKELGSSIADYQKLLPQGVGEEGEVVPGDTMIVPGIPVVHEWESDENLPDKADLSRFQMCEKGSHWTGEMCVEENEECSDNDSNRVKRWTLIPGEVGVSCEETDECKTGFPDGKGNCAEEGDSCSDGLRRMIWEFDGTQYICTPQPECRDSWYSFDSGSDGDDACIPEGQDCTTKGQEGIVEFDKEYTCRLTMESAIGYKLFRTERPVSSEEECYDLCYNRSDGCSAYSYQEGRCATAGSSEVMQSLKDDDALLKYTKNAMIHPHFDLLTNTNSVTVNVMPFNSDITLSFSKDANNFEQINNGQSVELNLGETGFFEMGYEMNGVDHVIDESVRTGDAPVEFGVKIFDLQVEGQTVTYRWNVDLEEGQTVEIRYPGSDEFVPAYSFGRGEIKFDTPGQQVMYMNVKDSDGRNVYEGSTQPVMTSCDVENILDRHGKCVMYEIVDYEIRISDLHVDVIWNLRLGQGVGATLSVDGMTYLYDGSNVGIDFNREGELVFELDIFKGEQSLFKNETTKVIECSETYFNGSCVSNCPSNDGIIGVWRRENDGECYLDCPRPDYKLMNDNVCVLRAGRECPGQSIDDGMYEADGEGGCSIVCDDGYTLFDNTCVLEASLQTFGDVQSSSASVGNVQTIADIEQAPVVTDEANLDVVYEQAPVVTDEANLDVVQPVGNAAITVEEPASVENAASTPQQRSLTSTVAENSLVMTQSSDGSFTEVDLVMLKKGSFNTSFGYDSTVWTAYGKTVGTYGERAHKVFVKYFGGNLYVRVQMESGSPWKYVKAPRDLVDSEHGIPCTDNGDGSYTRGDFGAWVVSKGMMASLIEEGNSDGMPLISNVRFFQREQSTVTMKSGVVLIYGRETSNTLKAEIVYWDGRRVVREGEIRSGTSSYGPWKTLNGMYFYGIPKLCQNSNTVNSDGTCPA